MPPMAGKEHRFLPHTRIHKKKKQNKKHKLQANKFSVSCCRCLFTFSTIILAFLVFTPYLPFQIFLSDMFSVWVKPFPPIRCSYFPSFFIFFFHPALCFKSPASALPLPLVAGSWITQWQPRTPTQHKLMLHGVPDAFSVPAGGRLRCMRGRRGGKKKKWAGDRESTRTKWHWKKS